MKLQTFATRRAAWLASLLLAAGLAGCSGGSPAVPAVNGTAAVGKPLANAAVSMQCVIGEPLTTTTSASGSFSLSLSGGQTFPCFISVTGGSPAVALHGIARGEGNVNVTPMTDLTIAAASRMAPAAWFTANKATLATALPALIAKLAAAQTALVSNFTNSGYTVPSGDLMTIAFSPTPGDVYDDLLETLRRSLADAGISYPEFVDFIAANGNEPATIPYTEVITAAEVASMPQLNSATVTVVDGVVQMKSSETGPSPVGAYVGGGQGNKAVLQLSGLAGMKLADFEEMSIEMKALTAQDASNPYVSVNIMIDLDCTQAPLSPTATVAEARIRHRLLTFDTFYKFIQAEPGSISSTEFSTINITPETGGWRISAGAVSGDNDTGVEEVAHGMQYTLTFNHALYPNACIVDGISADGGMFRDKTADPACDTDGGLPGTAPAICGKPHTGVFLFMGSSGNFADGDWHVRKVSFNDLTFAF